MSFRTSNLSLKPQLELSDFYGSLLHFKFFSDFTDRIAEEVKNGNKFNNSEESRIYQKLLNEFPAINPYCIESKEYTGSQLLVDLGLMHTL